MSRRVRRAVRLGAGILTAGLALGVLGTLATGGTAAAAPPAKTELTFHDSRIDASSGLAVSPRIPGYVFTVNDHEPTRVFGVRTSDGYSGATMRLNNAKNVNWEAIAPGAGRSLWVGDIGDNDKTRSSITAYKFDVPDPPRTGFYPATAYQLAYPDGAHDAEAMLVDPRDNTVYVATKDGQGGTLYKAGSLGPGRNQLTKVTTVPAGISDGAFRPDGAQFVLRTPTTGYVYSAPGKQTGSFALPKQAQGEGVAYTANGKALLLSSEGANSAVLKLKLSAVLKGGGGSASPSATASPSSSAAGGTGDTGASEDSPSLLSRAFFVVPFVIALGAILFALFLRRRPAAAGAAAPAGPVGGRRRARAERDRDDLPEDPRDRLLVPDDEEDAGWPVPSRRAPPPAAPAPPAPPPGGVEWPTSGGGGWPSTQASGWDDGGGWQSDGRLHGGRQNGGGGAGGPDGAGGAGPWPGNGTGRSHGSRSDRHRGGRSRRRSAGGQERVRRQDDDGGDGGDVPFWLQD